MYYACIENNKISSILTYLPNVPESVSVVQLDSQQYDDITNNRKRLDPVLKQVVDISKDLQDLQAIHSKREEARAFLESSDWKVLRHIREKALNQTTSLTEEEYLALEQQRADAASIL